MKESLLSRCLPRCVVVLHALGAVTASCVMGIHLDNSFPVSRYCISSKCLRQLNHVWVKRNGCYLQSTVLMSDVSLPHEREWLGVFVNI